MPAPIPIIEAIVHVRIPLLNFTNNVRIFSLCDKTDNRVYCTCTYSNKFIAYSYIEAKEKRKQSSAVRAKRSIESLFKYEVFWNSSKERRMSKGHHLFVHATTMI